MACRTCHRRVAGQLYAARYIHWHNPKPQVKPARIEVNFVDAFLRNGHRFAGMATVVERGEPAFDTLLPNLRSALAHRIRAIVTIAVTKALPLTSPAYDEGKTEAELRRAWTTRFRMLQPFKRFEE